MWEWIKNNKLLAGVLGLGGVLMLYLFTRPRAEEEDGGVLPLITPTAPFYGGAGPSLPEGVIAGGGLDRAPPTGSGGGPSLPSQPGQQTVDAQFAQEQRAREDAAARELLELERQDRIGAMRRQLDVLIADRRGALKRAQERLRPLLGVRDPKLRPERQELRARVARITETLQRYIRERATLV